SPASAPIDEASANIAPAIAVDMLNIFIFAMVSFLPSRRRRALGVSVRSLWSPPAIGRAGKAHGQSIGRLIKLYWRLARRVNA
ncbi:MAG: hypothetical protein ACREDI_12760, partial [Roseiarcus sp.]